MISHPVLEQLAFSGMRLGLERVSGFLQYLGEPHRAYPSVHVGGTNGKGSVCAFVTAALVEAGYAVGTNMSPHVEAVNERFQLSGRPIDDAALIEAIEAHDRARWDWARSARIEDSPLTYFEFVTTLAMMLFAQRSVDVAVFEVGLGGRLDATNVLHPQVCAITHIGLDHTAELGSTLTEIAGEKAGILEPGVPLVMGPMPAEARDEIERLAKIRRTPLWRPGRELMREHRTVGWSFSTPDGSLTEVTLGLDGEHQGANALVAMAVLHQLRRQGFYVPDEAIRAGLEGATLPGRLERPIDALVLDGAHNVDGARVLADWLGRQARPESRILLWGMGVGRDPIHIIEPLLPHVDEVVTTRCAHPRARPSLELAQMLQELDVLLADGGPIEEALPEVYREAHETVVAGSLFVAGAARSLVRSGVLDGITPGQGPREEEEEEAEDV